MKMHEPGFLPSPMKSTTTFLSGTENFLIPLCH